MSNKFNRVRSYEQIKNLYTNIDIPYGKSFR
jgi:hypothetical protein